MNPQQNILLKALQILETREELNAFIKDVFTAKEILEIGNRIIVAEMLLEEKLYKQIEKETGLSSATIAKISKSMQNSNAVKNIFYKLHGKEKYKNIKARNLEKHNEFRF